jgi:hypothetical protein
MSAINKLVASFALATAFAAGSAQATTYGLADGSFETQGAASNIVNSYCYGTDCASGAWTFPATIPTVAGDGNISQGSGAWGAPIGNSDGSYFAFVQIQGSFSQTFQATQSGTVALDWIDATRSNSGFPNTYTVSVNNQQVGIYNPTNSAFAPETSAAFSLIAGSFYTVTFQGVPGDLADRTAFIDNVSISAFATPLPATLPLFATGLGALGLLGWRRKRKNSAAIAAV